MSQPVFKTSNWDVFPDGLIEHRASGYWVDPTTLDHKDWNGPWYHWPCHMAGKNWVDVPEFCSAFRAAMKIVHPDAPEDWLTRSVTQALEVSIDNLRYKQAQEWYELAHADKREQHLFSAGDFSERCAWCESHGPDWERASGSHIEAS